MKPIIFLVAKFLKWLYGFKNYEQCANWIVYRPYRERRLFWTLLYYYNRHKCPNITLKMYQSYAKR